MIPIFPAIIPVLVICQHNSYIYPGDRYLQVPGHQQPKCWVRWLTEHIHDVPGNYQFKCWGRRIGLMPMLLMPWLLVSDYQQPLYRLWIGLPGPCPPWGGISTSCAISVSRHYRKCKHLLMFSQNNSMMTSSNGNIFRVTGHLCGEFTGPGEFPTQRPVTRSFDVFFDLRLNKRLSKQSWGWWFETPSWSLWRQCNAIPKVLRHYGREKQGIWKPMLQVQPRQWP